MIVRKINLQDFFSNEYFHLFDSHQSEFYPRKAYVISRNISDCLKSTIFRIDYTPTRKKYFAINIYFMQKFSRVDPFVTKPFLTLYGRPYAPFYALIDFCLYNLDSHGNHRLRHEARRFIGTFSIKARTPLLSGKRIFAIPAIRAIK